MTSLGLDYSEYMSLLGFHPDMHPIEIGVAESESKSDADSDNNEADTVDAKEWYLQQERKRKKGWRPAGERSGTYREPGFNRLDNNCAIVDDVIYQMQG